MKLTTLNLIFITVLVVSCDKSHETEEALQLFLPNSHHLITKELDSNGISYRVDKNNIIWYSTTSRNVVGHINAKVTAELSPVTSAAFNNKKILNIAKSRFVNNNISFALEPYNNDIILSWDDKDAVVGSTIINELLYLHAQAL